MAPPYKAFTGSIYSPLKAAWVPGSVLKVTDAILSLWPRVGTRPKPPPQISTIYIGTVGCIYERFSRRRPDADCAEPA